MPITNEQLFFEHIAFAIEKLTKAYTFALDEISRKELSVSAAVEDNIEYGILLRRLGRAIEAFKVEIKACLKDYIYLKDLNKMNEQHAARYLKSQLDALHTEKDLLTKHIPEEHLRSGLGRNYYFHKNIKNLTPETLLDYFEINYTLLSEEDSKKG